jgi:hypothetical protein
MEYKPGQQVVIKRNLGTAPGNEAYDQKDHYFYGESIRDIPLGSRGVIEKRCYNHYKIRVGSTTLCLRTEEYSYDEEFEKEEQARKNSLLEGILTQEEPCLQGSNGEQHGFNPAFNAKDEFAIWVRQEFPELHTYPKGQKYETLTQRTEEVKQAANKAYDGVVTASKANGKNLYCQRKYLGEFYNNFRYSAPNNFAFTLEKFVQALELSRNNRFPYIPELTKLLREVG